MTEDHKTKKPTLLQILSVAGPLVCLVHCLAVPLFIGLLPALTGSHSHPFGLDDHVMAFLVLPVCAAAIVPGYMRHRHKRVLVFMAVGMSSVIFGSFFAEPLIRLPGAEIPINMAGSLFLVTASLLNLRLAGSCCNGG